MSLPDTDPVRGCIHCARIPTEGNILYGIAWKGHHFVLQTCWECAGRYSRKERRQAFREAKKRYIKEILRGQP